MLDCIETNWIFILYFVALGFVSRSLFHSKCMFISNGLCVLSSAVFITHFRVIMWYVESGIRILGLGIKILGSGNRGIILSINYHFGAIKETCSRPRKRSKKDVEKALQESIDECNRLLESSKKPRKKTRFCISRDPVTGRRKTHCG